MHTLENFSLSKNRTIGLLGGSFNPAHEGHLAISLYALKKLKLDEVWWLVSPQNPLKKNSDLANYDTRMDSARAVAKHLRIRVLDIESRYCLRYSYQTIAFLQRRFRGTHFVWLMGADNLAQFHRWRRWHKILMMIPLFVFDRVPYSHTALRSKAWLRTRAFSLKNSDLRKPYTAPGLYFVRLRPNPISSTALRKTLGKHAFLRHNEKVV